MRNYFTDKNEETKSTENALYYREILIGENQEDPITVIEKYVSNDRTKLYGTYNNIKDKKFTGQKFTAYINGKIKSKEKYSHDGQLIDTAEYFHPNGKLKIAYNYPYTIEQERTIIKDTLILIFKDSIGTPYLMNGEGYAELYIEDNTLNSKPHSIEKGNFKNHKRTGEWTGTFQNEKYTFVEQYNNGEVVSGISKDSLDNEFPYDESNYMKQPEYPGGIKTLRQFIANNYNYPRAAISAGVNGLVKVSFTINKTGNIVDLKVDQDLGYGTGEEAIRVLKRSKKWTPGIIRGVPVKVRFVLPVNLNTK